MNHSSVKQVWETYCVCSVSYYYYYYSFFLLPKVCPTNFSATTKRKSMKLTGMLSTMSRFADYFWNFQNGRHCHGNHKKKHEKLKVL